MSNKSKENEMLTMT